MCTVANEDFGTVAENDILSQVLSPTTCTSQRPLNHSSRNPPTRTGPSTRRTWNSMTTPSAWRSLHHSSPRSEKMHRAVDKLITLRDEGLSSSQSSSVGPVRTGLLVADQFDSLIPNGRENPCRGSENEQIRILLGRQRADSR